MDDRPRGGRFVRDALSILDQAIVQHTVQGAGDEVNADTIRDMLGLADRGTVWELLAAAMKGDAKTALTGFRGQYDAGAEPAVIIRDMLDLVHLLTRIKAAGPGAAAHGPAGEADAKQARSMADEFEMNALTRAWSLLMKGLSETQIAPDPAAAGEMALIRLCFAADLPTPDEALRALKKNSSDGAGAQVKTAGKKRPGAGGEKPAPPVVAAPSNDAHAPAELYSFKEVVLLAGKMRDAKLRTELESYVHLVSFAPGKIELRLHGAAPGDLANRLALRLKEWTKRQWIISVTAEKNGDRTLRDARQEEVMAHPMVQKTLELFPGAKVTAIREPDPASTAPIDEGDETPPVDPDVEFPDLPETTKTKTDKRNA